MTRLIVTADDYGYHRAYDEGMSEAAAAGAVDAVSAFARREGLGPEPLLGSGVEVGLHLDLEAPGDAPRAGARERREAERELEAQYAGFREAFGAPPAYLDGHHHCHAREGLGVVVAAFAVAHGLPVRSVSARHRRLLRCRGVATPDLLVGRYAESEPPIPAELEPERAASLPAVVEWMVHPGRPAGGSSDYDAGRLEDLRMLLEWQAPSGVERCSHRAALA